MTQPDNPNDNMRNVLYTIALFAISACSGAAGGDRPTEADITAAMKKTWEHGATSTRPVTDITINSIQMGTSDESSYAQQLDGVPKGATVTHAKIDFTQHEHYTDGDQDTRRIMTGLVYKDQFNEWTVMNAGVQYVK
jgi:hypothetical protein